MSTPRASSEEPTAKKDDAAKVTRLSSDPGDVGDDVARGQPAKWLGRSAEASPVDREYFALTAFMYEGPEGSVKEPFPAKTSEPVLEAAKGLLTPTSLKGRGWTLVELLPESWFKRASGCGFCLAMTAESGRSHILMPLSAGYDGTVEELNCLDRTAQYEICNGVRRKLDPEARAALFAFACFRYP